MEKKETDNHSGILQNKKEGCKEKGILLFFMSEVPACANVWKPLTDVAGTFAHPSA